MAKILVVDNAKFQLKRVQTWLQKAGHDVVTADNGESAINVYAEEKPDMVFMDIVMPVMDGLEALAQIKKTDSSSKVVMLTASKLKDTILDAKKKNADGYLVKPIDQEQLLQKVRELSAS
jgi:CheY-like chemotaxis protein